MKRIALIAIILLLTSCESSTQFGQCVGLFGDRDPHTVYRPSIWNALWSIMLIETVIVPVFWATDYAYCPVGEKLVDSDK